MRIKITLKQLLGVAGVYASERGLVVPVESPYFLEFEIDESQILEKEGDFFVKLKTEPGPFHNVPEKPECEHQYIQGYDICHCGHKKTPKRFLAPALYQNNISFHWKITSALFESKLDAKQYIKDFLTYDGDREVIWPAPLVVRDGRVWVEINE